MLAMRTIEDRTPRSARPITVVSTTLRARRVPLCSSPAGRAGSSSVAGRPSFPGEPMLPAATSGFPVPASASPYASMIGTSAAATASSPPDGSRSCRCATWMTPSASAAASSSPSRSPRSPRRTFAPSADTAAAAGSDRARPVTSCPAATSSGMMDEPEWPVPPVTKTRTSMLLGKVVVRSAENVDAEGDVEAARAVAGQAHQQRSHPFQPAGHLQAADIEGTQSEAFDERRHTRLGPRIVSGEEHVQRVLLGQNVAEDGVERLHDVRARRDGLGDLLGTGSALRGDQPGGVGVEGVGDVDDDLAVQRVPVLADHGHRAGVGHGEHHDVPGRGGAGRPDGGPVERGGQLLGLGLVAADDLDAVAAGERPARESAGHGPHADDADAAHEMPAFRSRMTWELFRAYSPRRIPSFSF